MIKAIVYTSNTGYTAQYANLLANKTGLPVFSLKEAGNKLEDGSNIIYLGWLMAGKIKGYNKAEKHFKVSAVCAVGMAASGTQIDYISKSNSLSPSMPLFMLQGGFDIKKLRGIYKLMMLVMVKTAGKALSKKTDRTPEEEATLQMMLHGGNFVSERNLIPVLEWCKNEVF
ncbi:MAG: flavodoxin domain-containing protein [Clostridiaceae bacterium]|nr:flavodoxin domain-containing protein [Clostridiaceae bacterium]